MGDLSPADFQEHFVRRGQPVVIRQGLEQWPALTRWADLDYLSGAFDEVDAPITVQQDGQSSVDRMSVSDFWRSVWTGTGDRHCYLDWPVPIHGSSEGSSSVAEDVITPAYFEGSSPLGATLFAGWNTRCGMHYHPSGEAILCQVVGKKRVLLFSPQGKKFKYVYPFHWFSEHYLYSQVAFPRDGSWPDTEDYPDFDKTSPVEIILEPGDMLYIPIFWWHVTFGPDTNLSVAYFWMASFRARYFSRIGLRSNYLNRFLLKRFLSLAPLRELVKRTFKKVAPSA